MDIQKYTEYAERLSRYFKLPLIVLCIGLFVLVISFFVVIKLKCLKTMSIILITCLRVGLFGYYFRVYLYQKDIKNNDYIEYTGEFYVESYYYATKSGLFILIKTPNDEKPVKYRAYGNIDVDNETSYYGKFVVGKNSKALVDISIE